MMKAGTVLRYNYSGRICFILLLFLHAGLYQSCIRKDMGMPPDVTHTDPQIEVTMTLSGLMSDSLGILQPYSSGNGNTFAIQGDYTVTGIVIANDRSGNFYKQIVIDDSSAAITVMIDANSLYAEYPVGRRIYIKLNGLCLGRINGLPVIGYAPDSNLDPVAIPVNRIEEHIIKGSTENPVPIFDLPASSLGYIDSDSTISGQYLNRLVRIGNMRFADAGNTYADVGYTTSRDLISCDEYKLTLRTSNYANFAANRLPYRIGTITGIYTVYANTSGAAPQLIIRDSSDVRFDSDTCTGSGNIAGPGIIFSEKFNNAVSGIVDLPGWTNRGASDAVRYKYGISGSSAHKPYAQVTAYQSGLPDITSWLITPAIDLTNAHSPELTFATAAGYSADTTSFKVLISTDYLPGSDPAAAHWTELPASFAIPPVNGYSSFVSSGIIDLSAYHLPIYIAWKYAHGFSAMSETWELDEILIKEGD